MPVLTEQEHRKLICPIMTQFVATLTDGTPRCIASQCALWRWAELGYNSRNLLPEEKPGYCGLGN